METEVFASWLNDSNDVTAKFLEAGKLPGMINLGGGLPDPSLYPKDALTAFMSKHMASSTCDWLEYAPVAGLPALREAIAVHETSRGLPSKPENILVTSGGLQALSIVGQAFIDINEPAIIQSPTYLGLLDAWRPRQPDLKPFSADLASSFDELAQLSQLAYFMPAFANPDGRCLSEADLQKIITSARVHKTLLVEDDPYRDLYYERPAPPSLSARAHQASLPYLHIGSLSKTVAPGLRVGWINAPAEIISRLLLVKQGSDMTSPGLPQLLAADAIRGDLIDAHVSGFRKVYRSRRDALLASLNEHLDKWFDWDVPSGGMFVWLRAKSRDLDTFKVFEQGLANGVCISPGLVFDPGNADRRTARLNFTFNDERTIEEGVRRLSRVISSSLVHTEGT